MRWGAIPSPALGPVFTGCPASPVFTGGSLFAGTACKAEVGY